MPLRSDWSERTCPIARSLDVVGDAWVLLILKQALSGVRRFDDLRRNLGAADNILSRRLQAMVDAGLLRRTPYRKGNRTRQEYLLTAAGEDLLPVVNALAIWGEKYRPKPENGHPLDIWHLTCDGLSTTGELCSGCGELMVAGEVEWRRRPADQLDRSGQPAEPPISSPTP